MYASGRQLEEFKGCTTPHDVFECLTAADINGELPNACFFERSITQFVPNDDMKDLLRQCLNRVSTARPSIESISKHTAFERKEREVSRLTTVTSRMLSAIIEEKELLSSCNSNTILLAGEPERDQVSEQLEEELSRPCVVSPEPLPPSLWLFLPPTELEIDLTQRASFFSEDQWVSKLKRLQQQRAEELRFPLVFMCESCESGAAIPCSIATTTKYGVSVSSSLLSLVMPLVRETMLFLEARAILSNGLSVGEASGLTGPQQWEELRTFYSALERMELATVNPVNEVELAPMEQQLKSRDQVKAQEVLDKLTDLIFSEDKREYVRNLLDALVSDEDLVAGAERTTEVATFYDVFGVLGVPMIIMFVVSAAWTFMMAAIQIHADSMANAIMNTTEFDNGEFWLLPKPENSIIVSSVVLLTIFGIGYTALAVTMMFFYRAGAPKEDLNLDNISEEVVEKQIEPKGNFVQRLIVWIRELPADIREHYFTAALDLPKLVFQTLTLATYLRKGFPTAIIYYYSVLLLCNWLVACYRSQRYVADPDLIIARLYYT
ncbi:hypothetical protein JG688_00005090 [Phytophthora aleatoria]|uniref:Uncharacterized protein n=1 Tax=Phytophthora aleatoria TaxID=2496075 RepID=A0A8J5MAW0_9STRA|nr:hypothetical protein JG688_00005090 [Phytophthora aleatoria]